jgi:integrase
MARPKSDAPIDLSVTHELSEGLISRLNCPPGAAKAFLRDKDVTGLRVRVTANGAKSFVYEAKLNGKAISRTLGGFPLMPIEDAKAKARELAKTVKTDKQDPRELERQQEAAAAAKVEADRVEAAASVAAASAHAVTVGDAWTVYLAERKPRWGDLHYKDHIKLARAGGVPCKRGTDGRGVTIAMPLYPLMALTLRDLTAPVIEAWAAKEAQTRATSARLAWRLLKGFLGWCSEQPAYAGLLSGNPAKTKKSREALGKAAVKQDALLREQLPVWFEAVQKIQNPIIAAALQVMLLTGARPGEVLALRWGDLNTKWRGITIHDKVEGERIIPLTLYVWHLIATLPKRNEQIFSSATAKAGALTAPRKHHVEACTTAGIDGLSLHGLRRSFKSLTEWLEIPAGVVAQLMGHKPSATAEKHYTVRPLDLLRVHHEKIEAWILEQAGIVFDAKAAPGALRVVAGHHSLPGRAPQSG